MRNDGGKYADQKKDDQEIRQENGYRAAQSRTRHFAEDLALEEAQDRIQEIRDESACQNGRENIPNGFAEGRKAIGGIPRLDQEEKGRINDEENHTGNDGNTFCFFVFEHFWLLPNFYLNSDEKSASDETIY